MKFTRKANAQWFGGGKDGKGQVTTASTVLNKTQYSFKTRFEDGVGTNPEELVGAAHAGCFAMKLSFLLGDAGFTPDELNVDASVLFEDGNVTEITLDLKGKVTGIGKDKFSEIAEEAKKTCPISQLLKAKINLNASLV
ncbi:osmotically inducible protein OsmC [Muriicola jejuensis]|uniref:OsmC family peroxiredoxin n=1 Tax=Muriicola jejuensis TaxID=504488 RepID=A0A6P0UE64_9FLAO|nr:OsmC family protein [Muriicola jejuensis]NER11297.1 OsmC family peroxiredoxin [Muriicola jejuensis]SMP21664.1 osmotically inducible protein OsmC [Muriicola jejuensis]